MTIARAALEAVDPRAIVARCLRVEGGSVRVHAAGAARDFDLSRFQKIFVLGFGKADGPMAQATENALGSRVTEGLVVVKPGQEARLQRIRQVCGGHPVLDENSVRAATMMADLADDQTLVITLISGGGSSLLAAPVSAGITLADIQETTRQLLACGAEIAEINCIRKHILLLAGGRLARHIAPATPAGIVLSNVVGDDLPTVAAGPTSPDATTYVQTLTIIDFYGIRAALAKPVLEHLRAGAEGMILETSKPGATELSFCFNVLAGTNLLTPEAAAAAGKRLGYDSLILTSHLAGEAREAARVPHSASPGRGPRAC